MAVGRWKIASRFRVGTLRKRLARWGLFRAFWVVRREAASARSEESGVAFG